MQSHLATFGSDQINKYGYRFGIRALESSIKQGWRGIPMFISHDFHRPAGVSKAIALHIHSTQVLLKGIITLPETSEEQKVVEDFATVYLLRRLDEIDKEDRDRLTDGLANHMSPEATLVRRECVSVLDPGIAKRVFPELFPSDETNKRSLALIKDLQVLAPGVFKVGDYAIFAHRYFRRSLSQLNNLNSIFLEKLCELRNDTGLEIKIALDADSIGLASTYLTPIELEYWRGPKFNDDLSTIPVGVTSHKASRRERYYHGIDRTEFWWHTQNGNRSLECEEILDNASFGIGNDVYGCRYVHSMVDEISNLPDHLDGAIREYREEPFLERIDVDISKAGKNTRYVKLWRIDGKIELASWKEMICDFFRGNSLVGEYLNGDNTKNQHEQEATLESADPQNIIRPIQVSEEDAVHIAVSYHDTDGFPLEHDRSVIANGIIGIDGTRIDYIELSGLDLVKLIERDVSGKIKLPAAISYLAFEDMDINYPLLFFQGDKALEDAKAFIRCLNMLCRHFANTGAERFVTASVGIRYDDVVAMFTFAGFANLLAVVFDDGVDTFPASLDDVGAWCEATQEALNRNNKGARFTKAAEELLKQTGSFFLPRLFIDGESISEATAQALESGMFYSKPVYTITQCRCAACNTSYLDCPCVAFLDETSEVTPENFRLFGFFITDRPA